MDNETTHIAHYGEIKDGPMSQELLPERVDGMPRLLTVEAVGDRLSVGRSTIFSLMASGALPSVKVGRRRLVLESVLCEYIARLAA